MPFDDAASRSATYPVPPPNPRDGVARGARPAVPATANGPCALRGLRKREAFGAQPAEIGRVRRVALDADDATAIRPVLCVDQHAATTPQ